MPGVNGVASSLTFGLNGGAPSRWGMQKEVDRTCLSIHVVQEYRSWSGLGWLFNGSHTTPVWPPNRQWAECTDKRS